MRAKLITAFIVTTLFSIISVTAWIQEGTDLKEYLQSQSIPVEDIGMEGNLFVVKLNFHSVPKSESMKKIISTVLQKAAEKNPDVSLVGMEVFLDGEPNTRMVLSVEAALDCVQGKISEEEMLQQVLVSAVPDMTKLLAGAYLSGPEPGNDSADGTERIDPVGKGEILDRTDTTGREKGGVEPQPIEPRQDRTRGGGGVSSGNAVLASGKASRLLLLVGLLCLGSLILIVGIHALKRRQTEQGLKVRASLEVCYEDGGHKIFLIQKTKTSIGRDEKNDLVLHDTNTSSFHAEIVISSSAFIIRDLGSTNGTIVNGERVSQKSIFLDDEIVIGATKLLLRI